MSILNNLINGISLGSVYAIIALGYTMVYGIAKMLNFAHGDVIMVGAYICFFTMSGLSGSFEEGSLAGAVVPALAGVLLWGLLFILPVAAILSRLYFKKTGSIWAGGFINALVVTLYAISNTVVSAYVL